MTTSLLGRRFVAAAEPAVATGVFLMTVPNVELLEVGEDWETSTGIFTFTEDDLVSAVASQADPAVRTPVIKLGHTDPRFDGQPTFGRILNLHTENNGMTLLGDLVGVPEWLAQCMATAFPRRSIEGWWEVNTRTGNTWPFVLTGVALLGSAYPAIDTLEDLAALWGKEPPRMVPADETLGVLGASEPVAATKGGALAIWKRNKVEAEGESVEHSHAHSHGGDSMHTHSHLHSSGNYDHDDGSDTPHEHAHTEATTMPKPKVPAQAAVSVEDVRRTYYDTLGPGEYWWWIREIRINPAELIVDDDEGHLFRVPYTLGSDDSVEFSDPIVVKIEYVDVAASAPQIPHVAGQLVAATWGDPKAAGRPEPPEPKRRTAATTTPKEEVHDVKVDEKVLESLGLSADASEEDINKALLEKLSAPASETTEPPKEGEVTEPPKETTEPPKEGAGDGATTTTTTEPPKEEGKVTLPEGMVAVDEAAWQQTQEFVTSEIAAKKERAKEERDNTIAEAVRVGKFSKARKEHYTKLWDTDPEGTRAAIASLSPGMIPVVERGVQGGEIDPSTTDNAYPESWKRQVDAAQRGNRSRVKVVND